MTGYDVVIVGGSVAGCTAAVLYGRAGLRVALLEKHRNAAAFKALCGHFVLGGTGDMLRRAGLWEPILDAGGHAAGVSRWTPYGWTLPPAGAPTAVSLRRQVLDPMLRRVAAETGGVDLMLGHKATGLLTDGGRVVGVRTRTGDGTEHEHRGRLVVGADGHLSPLAGWVGAREDRAPNNRFGLWAYYRGVVPRGPGGDYHQIWPYGPDTGILARTDDGLTMLVAFPVKSRLAEFQADRAGALEGFFRALPDAPDIAGAERVSKVIGMTDYPCVRRDPTPAPGVFLVGDAALTGDPLPAVGCGWAFRGAEWLVESTVPALRGEATWRAAAAGYRRRLAFVRRHDDVARQGALAKPPNALQAAVLRAASLDPVVGRRAYLFAMRAIPVSGLINPAVVARSLLVAARTRRAAAPAVGAATG
jgi:flavin-dependent dehydrogenase